MIKRMGIYPYAHNRKYWAILGIFEDDTVRILEGYNMGEITAKIIFPNTNTAITYIAGVWPMSRADIAGGHVVEMEPVANGA